MPPTTSASEEQDAAVVGDDESDLEPGRVFSWSGRSFQPCFW